LGRIVWARREGGSSKKGGERKRKKTDVKLETEKNIKGGVGGISCANGGQARGAKRNAKTRKVLWIWGRSKPGVTFVALGGHEGGVQGGKEGSKGGTLRRRRPTATNGGINRRELWGNGNKR